MKFGTSFVSEEFGFRFNSLFKVAQVRSRSDHSGRRRMLDRSLSLSVRPC